jgi:hypothetical protein
VSSAPRVRIESDGTVGDRTRVFIDGKDVTNAVAAVTWHLGVGEGAATADVTFLNVKIDAEAELATAPEPEPARTNAFGLPCAPRLPVKWIQVRSPAPDDRKDMRRRVRAILGRSTTEDEGLD